MRYRRHLAAALVGLVCATSLAFSHSTPAAACGYRNTSASGTAGAGHGVTMQLQAVQCGTATNYNLDIWTNYGIQHDDLKMRVWVCGTPQGPGEFEQVDYGGTHHQFHLSWTFYYGSCGLQADDAWTWVTFSDNTGGYVPYVGF